MIEMEIEGVRVSQVSRCAWDEYFRHSSFTQLAQKSNASKQRMVIKSTEFSSKQSHKIGPLPDWR